MTIKKENKGRQEGAKRKMSIYYHNRLTNEWVSARRAVVVYLCLTFSQYWLFEDFNLFHAARMPSCLPVKILFIYSFYCCRKVNDFLLLYFFFWQASLKSQSVMLAEIIFMALLRSFTRKDMMQMEVDDYRIEVFWSGDIEKLVRWLIWEGVRRKGSQEWTNF